MEQLNVLRRTIERLETLRIEYFLTGSMASNFYGLPRLTHDVDIVIKFDEKNIDEMLRAFGRDSYISEEGIRESLSGSGMFNAIDLETGFKVDFWIFRGDAFGKSCFERCSRVQLASNLSGVIASPEDVILHKLFWNSVTPSERQWRDARGIVLVRHDALDLEYMKKWAEILGVWGDLEKLLAEDELPNAT